MKTPLATIQNDMEYIASVYPHQELKDINNSVKNSINKIINVVDNAFFMMNNQEDKTDSFLLSSLVHENEYLELDNPNDFNITITTNKNDFINYFKLLTNTLKTLNLFINDKNKLTLSLNKNDTTISLTAYFKTIENDNIKETFNSLSEYINIKNNIDSLDAVLSDLILKDLGLSVTLSSNDNLIFFTLTGINL